MKLSQVQRNRRWQTMSRRSCLPDKTLTLRESKAYVTLSPMESNNPNAVPANDEALLPFVFGEWRVEPETGRLTGRDNSQRQLEPQLMALLMLLAESDGRVLARERIEAALWPKTIVGEDTLARAISRLRRALDDSAQTPRYIETLPKRGYRFVAPITRKPFADGGARSSWWLRSTRLGAVVGLASLVGALWFVFVRPSDVPAPQGSMSTLVARADDYYMRFTRADNEAAIGLYEQVLAVQPDNNGAHAGLANALVQRVVRWPRNPDVQGAVTLTEALDRGLTASPESQAILARAIAMAERAVRIAPEDPDALKSLAFVLTAQGNLDRATTLYQQVLALDADAWPALINLGEIASMRGDEMTAIGFFERAWTAMGRAYESEPQRVGPWHVPLGIEIGDLHNRRGEVADAELWYRRVLSRAPYHPEATVRLAALLAASGARDEAQSLCQALMVRIGSASDCPGKL